MDIEARLAIFAIMENNHGMLPKWRAGWDLICTWCGLAMLILSVSIKGRNIVGASVEIERMPLT